MLPPPLGVCASVCDIKGRAFLTGCARARARATRRADAVFFFDEGVSVGGWGGGGVTDLILLHLELN